jgi:hypothetical protein
MVASCVTTRSTSVCLEYFRRELFHSLRTDKLPRLYQGSPNWDLFLLFPRRVVLIVSFPLSSRHTMVLSCCYPCCYRRKSVLFFY